MHLILGAFNLIFNFCLFHLCMDSGQVVREIQHSRCGVTITTEDGCVYDANYAILSVSIGVLQSDLISFRPSMPVTHLPSFFFFWLSSFSISLIEKSIECTKITSIIWKLVQSKKDLLVNVSSFIFLAFTGISQPFNIASCLIFRTPYDECPYKRVLWVAFLILKLWPTYLFRSSSWMCQHWKPRKLFYILNWPHS